MLDFQQFLGNETNFMINVNFYDDYLTGNQSRLRKIFLLESSHTFWLFGKPSTTFRTADLLKLVVMTNYLSIA